MPLADHVGGVAALPQQLGHGGHVGGQTSHGTLVPIIWSLYKVHIIYFLMLPGYIAKVSPVLAEYLPVMRAALDGVQVGWT